MHINNCFCDFSDFFNVHFSTSRPMNNLMANEYICNQRFIQNKKSRSIQFVVLVDSMLKCLIGTFIFKSWFTFRLIFQEMIIN